MTKESVDTVVVGAGHAGLSVSYALTQAGVAHLLLERERLAQRWRAERWDSFRLLTPNWANWLVGYRPSFDDPDAFMRASDVVRYFEDYAATFDPPIREHTAVTGIRRTDDTAAFAVETADATFEARNVVVATGPYQRPRLPAIAQQLPERIVQLHSSGYKNAESLPPGRVLVVGAGSSGQQIAKDLAGAGREVYLATSKHVLAPRSYRGRDYFWWAELGGRFEDTADDLPGGRPAARLAWVLSWDAVDVWALAALGVHIVGRLQAVADDRLLFADDLADSLRTARGSYLGFRTWVDDRLGRFHGLYDSAEQPPHFAEIPVDPANGGLAAADISAVVWATGFTLDLQRWVHVPVFPGGPRPEQRRGVSTTPGLYFTGLPWLHRLRSAFIRGAQEDALYLAERIRDRNRRA